MKEGRERDERGTREEWKRDEREGWKRDGGRSSGSVRRLEFCMRNIARALLD